MATSLNVIRTLTIQAKTEGVDAAAASLNKLAGAQDNVAASSAKQEKATLAADKTLAKIQRTYDSQARAQQDLVRVQQTLANVQTGLDRARAQGLISQAEQNKLMQAAIVHHNSAGAAAAKHAVGLVQLSAAGKAVNVALAEVGTASRGLAGNLGAVGSVLSALGPVGLAIAAGIAVVTLGFGLAAKAALEFAEEMGKLADTAETVGVTVEQLRALQLVAGEVGVNTEQLDTGLGKFSAVLGQVRDGAQSAVDAFDRLSPGLAASVRNAKNTEEALNLVFDALRKADTAAAALGAKELFGKGGLGFVRIAGAAASLAELEKNINAVDKITGQQAKSWDALGDSISKNMKLAGTNVVSSFATPVLEALDAVSTIVLELSRTFKLLTFSEGQFDLSSLESFRVELQLLNAEITQFGAFKAVSNLAERLGFGPDFVSQVTTVINVIKLLASAFLDLINIVASAGSALGRFTVGDFAGALAQVNSARASFQNLGTVITDLGTAVTTAAPKVEHLGDVTVESATAASNQTREWIIFGNQVEKIGGIVPPVNTKINDFGKANDLAADKVKKVKEEVEKVDPVLKELGQVAGQLGASLVTAFLNGDSAAKALNTTLKSISSSAASSAINKLVTGDFSGAAISGAISIGSAIGSFLFGDDKDEKAQQEAAQKAAEAAKAAAEALQAARDAFAGLSKEIQDFTNTARGTKIGELTEALAAFSDESVKLQQAAIAAQNETALEAIRQTAAAGMNRFLRQFLNDVDDLISEFGGEGIIADARASVRNLMLEFTGLQDSIDEFARRTGADTEILRQNLQTSTFKALVEMLGDVPEISQTTKDIQHLKGIAGELDDALVQLGVSAEDAAFIVEARLNVSLRKLSANFLDPIIREINAFVGGDWINQATDLLARVRQLTADATELGIQTTLIQTFFVLAAQDIINQNQLVGFSFQALTNMLGLANAGLHEFDAALSDVTETIKRSVKEIAAAIQTNEDRLFNTLHRSDSLADQLARFDLAAQREREAEIAAGGEALASLERALMAERLNIINDFMAAELEAANAAAASAAEEADRVRQEQIDAAKSAADERARIFAEAEEFIRGQVRRISEFINSFLSGPSSILPPSQQLATAQAHFASELAAAASGNRDALSDITTSAQSVIDAVRRYFGSSTAGQNIIQSVLGQLTGLPSLLSPEEFIVEGLTTPIEDVSTTITTETKTQTDALSLLLNQLKIAAGSGDPQALAIALLPLFDRLDTSVNGLLDFNEFSAGLRGMASDASLRDMFTRLDLDQSGSLDKLELIKIATQGTGAQLPPLVTNTNEANALLQQQIARITDATSQNVLWLSQIWDKLTVLIQQVIFGNQYLSMIAGWAPGSGHAMGGRIHGGILGRDSVHAMLTPGEMVIRQPVARLHPWLENFNATGFLPHNMAAANDNTFTSNVVVVAIGQLERSLLRGIRALIEAELHAAGIVSQPLREANKITRTRRGEKKKVA